MPSELLHRLVVATGSKQKIEAYRGFPFQVVENIDPEKDCGVPEVESDDAGFVAWMKTQIVIDALNAPGDTYFTGIDILSKHAKGSIQDTESWTVLHKLGRDGELSDSEKERYVDETKEMYCTDVFSFCWDTGTALRHLDSGIHNVSVVQTIGEFSPVPEEIIENAFQTGVAYSMSPRIPLAKIAQQYMRTLIVRNRSEQHRGVSIDTASLWKLVVDGVLPYDQFLQLLHSSVQTKGDKYAEVVLDFNQGLRYNRERT